MRRPIAAACFCLILAGCLLLPTSVSADIIAAYLLAGPAVIGAPGNVLPEPSTVIGKEFSDFLDRDENGISDPSQVVAWDGSGGTVDGVDYSGTLPAGTLSGEFDALAHRRDLLFEPLRGDSTFLLFSTGNGASPTGTGVVATTEGQSIGRAGDINYEMPGTPTKGIWATGPQIDGTNIPFDVDGLEIWGPEPPGSDADRFSLLTDAKTGTSVFTSAGAAYISHSLITAAVTSTLGSLPSGINDFAIDLDALMSNGDDDDFGPGDSIIFSIRQIANANDSDGFYATGSEIFTLDATPTGIISGFLSHGGHVWDHSYSLLAMKESSSGRQLDINAIEAASAVPEPSAFAFLGLIGLVAGGRSWWTRRR